MENKKCTCSFTQKMVGDGCEVCNPEMAEFYKREAEKENKMANNWKGTNEPVEQNGSNGVNTKNGKCVAITFNFDKRKEDAKLFADALNTIQECGLMPSELKNQRDELLKALEGAIDGLDETDIEYIQEYRELIKKIKG